MGNKKTEARKAQKARAKARAAATAHTEYAARHAAQDADRETAREAARQHRRAVVADINRKQAEELARHAAYWANYEKGLNT